MNRRSFIKLTAIAGTSATLTGCGNPEHHVIRFVPEEELIPGVAEWKPSVCPACGAGCGLSVRVMPADVDTVRDGQQGIVRTAVAKKLEGTAAHPVNRGGLCARGQAAIQITYHPDRLAQPLRRSGARGDGQYTAVSWDAAVAGVVAGLNAIDGASDRRSLAIITGGARDHRQRLVEEFARAFGAPPVIGYQLFSDQVLRRANQLSFGYEQLPTFDLAHAHYVLSFGADFLGTWNSPVAQSAAYGEMRRGRPGIRGAFVQVESRMTTTGACADEWLPATPGTEGVLALGIAHLVMRDKRHAADNDRAGRLIDGWSAGLPGYTPPMVERQTGVAAARIERIARAFAESPAAMAIVGGPPLAQTNGLFTALAVNALDSLAGPVGRKGGIGFTPQIRQPLPAAGAQSIDQFATAVLSGAQSPQVLLIDRANVVFATPRAWRVREALSAIPLIVSFGSFIDETSVLADLILPDHSFLESWTDAMPESGSMTAVAGAAGPVMKPLFDTRATPDLLLDISRQLRRPLKLPWQTFDEMVKGSFERFGAEAWATVLEQGVWWGQLPKTVVESSGVAAARVATNTDANPTSRTFIPPQPDGDPEHYPLLFLPYPSHAFLDGSLSHLPWLQELPDPITSAMWSSWMEINPRTAERLGIRQGDVVEAASRIGAVRAPAFINPGLAPDIVAMPVGQGHTSFTRYASGRGANPIEILAPIAEPATGTLAWAATRVRLTRVADADGRLILFSAGGELREEPHHGEVR